MLTIKSLPAFFSLLLISGLVTLLGSCQSSHSVKLDRAARAKIAAAEKKAKAIQALPEPAYAAGTYEHFITHHTYPGTMEIYRNKALLSKANRKSPIYICLSQQRGRLYVNGQVAADWPVSTGVGGHETPTGSYTIVEKKKEYASNSYGNIKNAEGRVIKRNADISKDEVPEGGSFVGSPMPNWMRLTWDGVGMHTGKVKPGRRLSHGCIRTPGSIASQLFELTKIGHRVYIVQGMEACYPARTAIEESKAYQASLKAKNDALEHARKVRNDCIAAAKAAQAAKAKNKTP